MDAGGNVPTDDELVAAFNGASGSDSLRDWCNRHITITRQPEADVRDLTVLRDHIIAYGRYVRRLTLGALSVATPTPSALTEEAIAREWEGERDGRDIDGSLRHAFLSLPQTGRDEVIRFARRIWSLALSSRDERGRVEAQREAFSAGWVACCKAYSMPVALDIDIAAERTYPYPAPPAPREEVRLACGDRIVYAHPSDDVLYRGWHRFFGADGESHQWYPSKEDALRPTDTIADLRAVERLASRVGGGP